MAIWFDVQFAQTKTGLGTVGYRQYDATGGDAVARTTAGVVEIGNGAYGALIDIDDDARGIQWDTGDASIQYANEDIDMMKRELWELQGLDINNPMTVTPTDRDASADVAQTISGDGTSTTTVTRDP